MLMPEAAMDENDLLKSRKDDVRVSRQALTMKTVAITQAVQKAPNLKLGTHVFAPDAPHIFAAVLRGNGVDHAPAF